MIQYFIYTRKSSESEDRQVLSIESQINELKEMAQKQGLYVSEFFLEAKSAKEPGRPIFNEMMKRLSTGDTKGIICWKLDRLARNPVDGGQIVWLLQRGIIKEIRTIDRIYYPQDNVLPMTVELGMANQFILDLSQNTKRGLRAKAERGWLPGIPPPGYMHNKFKEKGEKEIIKDPLRFPLVKRMWELMLTGNCTVPQILTIANEQLDYKTPQRKKIGGKPLSRSILYKIFTNPFYYGWFKYQGELWKGAHEPMVTEEELDRVQILLGRKGRPRPKKYNFLFTGIIRCGECGAMVTADQKDQIICSRCKYKFSYKNRDVCPKCGIEIEKMKNPKILRYTYYHCTKRKNPRCSQGSVEVEKLKQLIDECLSKIEIDEEYKDFAIEYLNEVHEQETKTRDTILESKQKAYHNCLRKIDNLTRLKISSENSEGTLLSDEEFKRQKIELLKEKIRLEDSLNDAGQRVEKWLELSENTFNFACYARRWFSQGTPEQKRQIFTALGSNITLKDKKLIIELKKPFLIIQQSKKRVLTSSAQNMGFEPSKFRLNKAKNRAFGPALSCLLRG